MSRVLPALRPRQRILRRVGRCARRRRVRHRVRAARVRLVRCPGITRRSVRRCSAVIRAAAPRGTLPLEMPRLVEQRPLTLTRRLDCARTQRRSGACACAQRLGRACHPPLSRAHAQLIRSRMREAYARRLVGASGRAWHVRRGQAPLGGRTHVRGPVRICRCAAALCAARRTADRPRVRAFGAIARGAQLGSGRRRRLGRRRGGVWRRCRLRIRSRCGRLGRQPRRARPAAYRRGAGTAAAAANVGVVVSRARPLQCHDSGSV